MRRRTVLRFFASLIGSIPISGVRAWSQTIVFPGKQAQALRDAARIVLPSELGSAGVELVTQQFERYVRDYRAGADTEHGYGFTRIRPKPPSPAPTYLRQLDAFPTPLTRAVLEQSLAQDAIKDLPRLPDGKNVIADLMSFYFRGSDANDLCYKAAIQKDSCRGLEGSSKPPAPLKATKKETA